MKVNNGGSCQRMRMLQSEHRILMQKKMEGVHSHSGRLHIKKQKSQSQEWQRMGSSNSIQMYQPNDRKLLHQVNFEFDPTGANRKDGRVHSKQASRRIGGKVVIQREKRILHKENHQPQLSKRDTDSQINNGSEVILIGIKSCLVEKEKDEGKKNQVQKHTRYSSNAQSCGTRQQEPENIYLTNPPIPKHTTQDLFRQINRRMEEEKQSTRVRRTNQNCFFYNLKRKLQKEINRIQHQNDRKECKLLIEGCQIEKHRRKDTTVSALTDRSRPRTALASARTLSSASKSHIQKTKRPMSCKSRSQVESKQLRTIQAESRRLLGAKGEKQGKKQRNTVREKESEKKYIINSLITFDNSNSLKPYKSPPSSKTNLNRQKDNEKLNQILNECSSHQQVFSNLSSKMRTFQYYCKKMSAGMEDAGNKLTALNQAAQFDD